nr:hypothetical protein [Tanacetum cinerariifolium]
HLGKFDAKGDEGYFVGYSLSSKAFRFHKAHMETSNDTIRNSDAQDDSQKEQDCNADVPKSSGISNPTTTSKVPLADQVEPAISLTVESKILTVSSLVPTICLDISPESSSDDTFGDTTTAVTLNEVEADLSNMETSIPVLVDYPKRVRPIGTKWVLKNKKDERGIVIKNKARLVAQGYTQEEGIDYGEVLAPVARIEAIRLFLAYASFMGFIVYQMDVKSAFLYGTIDEEVYMMQPPGYPDLEFPKRVYKVEKAMGTIDQTLFIRKHKGEFLLVQVYVDDIIFRSSNPQLCREFKALMHDKFQMSTIGELTFFLGLQVLQKKDGIFLSQDKYVGDILKKFGYSDVRSMIGSLMYLTASRPDIMFAVCACARYQVTPKECHLYAVKRIFRYLKGHPKMRLWYPKESPFDLVAYSNSDYGGATQDRKSTTGGCQFLGRRLISWQCKKQTIVATSTTKAEYVAAASGCRQVFWIQNQMLDYGIETTNQETKIIATIDGKSRTISESSLRRHLKLNDKEGISSLPDVEHFENFSLMGYNILPSQRFTFQKGQFSHQWKFLIHTIMQCLSPKNELSSLSRDDRHGEAFLTVSSLDAGQDRKNIAKTSAMSHKSSPRVPSLDADEGSMQQRLHELMELYTSLQRQQSQMVDKIKDQDIEISGLKARVKSLEDKERRREEPIQEDAPITGGSNKVIAKHLSEYEQAEADLSVGEKIELISELVKYQDYLAEILKYQAQQSKPSSKKEQRKFYMSVLKSHAEWKIEHFRGMTLEQIKEKFILDISEEGLKEMIQLAHLEEVYIKALQVKHPIIV